MQVNKITETFLFMMIEACWQKRFPAGFQLQLILFQFLNVPMFRNVTLKCLTEIAGVSVNQYEEQFVNLFTLTMSQLKQVLC